MTTDDSEVITIYSDSETGEDPEDVPGDKEGTETEIVLHSIDIQISCFLRKLTQKFHNKIDLNHMQNF